MNQVQEKVTIKSVMDFLKKAVQEGHNLHPGIYLDEAQKLAVLLEDVDDEMIEAEMAYRGMRSGFIEHGDSAAASEVKSKASLEYKKFLYLQALRERVMATVQIAKKRTDLRRVDQ